MRVPQGMEGVVTDVVVFNREGVERDERTKEIEQELLAKYEKDHSDEIRIVHSNLNMRILSIAKNQKLANDLLNLNGDVVFPKGTKITKDMLSDVPLKSTDGIQVDDEGINLKVATLVRNAMQQMYLLDNVFQDKCEKVSKGDDLPPGVIRMVKVFIAVKLSLIHI